MNIMEVALALRGAPHLIAARPRGVVIRRTDRGMFLALHSGKPYRWSPAGMDLEGMDWQVFTVPQYQKMLAEQAAARGGEGENSGGQSS